MNSFGTRVCIVLGTLVALATVTYQLVCIGRANCMLVLMGLAVAIGLVALSNVGAGHQTGQGQRMP